MNSLVKLVFFVPLQQESEISNMEFRNYFSLHCAHMETQLIHANMELFAVSLQELINQQIKNHKEVLIVNYLYNTVKLQLLF